METAFLTVEITTPQKKWIFDDVLNCSVPGIMGNFQVLFNHAPLLSELEMGVVKLETSSGVNYYATSGGFLEVLNNRVPLLLETCEAANKIDIGRAKQAADRARKRLKEQSGDIDIARAEAALKRALNRIHVAKK